MSQSTTLDASLPPEIQALLSEQSELNQAQLESLSKALVEKRDEAKSYRSKSGAEEIWAKAEEAYAGIDDANRHEYTHMRWQVPPSVDSPVTTGTSRKGQSIRSNVFVRLTARYVDAGAAKLQEILLPTDEKSFGFEPTPDPELVNAAKSTQPLSLNGIPLERDPKPEEIQAAQPGGLPLPGGATPPLNPAQAPGVPLTPKDLAEEKMAQARDAAKKAETHVFDWHVEAQFSQAVRTVIFDGARLGVGILKGPFPCVRKSMATSRTPDGVAVTFVEKVVPDYKAVSPWNFFPAPSCGETIQHGDYVWERDFISARQVRDLTDIPGYNRRAIQQVLKEGPHKRLEENCDPNLSHEDDRYEIWYFYGVLTADEWRAIQSSGNPSPGRETTDEQSQEPVYAIVTMVNDSILYAAMNPLSSGKFPYHTFRWQRRSGDWFGVGIGEQVSMPQRTVNAAMRALLDNAGQSAGAQIVMDRDAIIPSTPDDYAITRNKIWFKSPDIDDVRKAFTLFQIPNIQPQLQPIIELAFRLAEESSNIPLISQGQSGATTPDTYGATQLQNNNANQLLRAVGYSFDTDLTKPVAEQDYEWLLLDPDVDEALKGDWIIRANGSAALVERAIQTQTIAQQGQLVASSSDVFGIDPKKWYAEYLKGNRLDPRNFQYTAEELEQKKKQPPPMPPQVQAAQIRAQVDMQRAQMDTDRDRIYVEAETQRTQAESESRQQELTMKWQLAQLEYANKRQISLEQVKAEIAQTTMKLATQKDLAASASRAVPQVLTPPSEPPGRAPVGEAFQR